MRIRTPLTPLGCAESPSPAGERGYTAPAPTPRPPSPPPPRGRSAPARANRASISRTSPASPPNRCATPVTSSRSPSSPSTSTKRRPARRPARQPREQRRIPGHIRRHRLQSRVERARIGQPGAAPHPRRARSTAWTNCPCAASTTSATRMRHPTRRSPSTSARSPAAATRWTAIRCSLHDAAPSIFPARTRARETVRRPTPPRPAPWGRAGARALGALATRHRIRAPLRLAWPPSRTRNAATPLRSAATASRRVAVKSSALGSPQISPITAPSAEHRKPFLHRPQGGAGIARVDMDELGDAQPRRIDPPRLEHRHPLLHPQQRFSARQLGEQEPRRPAVARAGGKQLAQRRPPAGAGQPRQRVARNPPPVRPVLRPARIPPPATRERPAATQLTTFMFCFCSYTPSPHGGVNGL